MARLNLENSKLHEVEFKNGKFGGARQVLTGHLTLTRYANPALFFDPNGGSWNVDLPAERLGQFFAIFNVGGTGELMIRDSAGSAIATLTAGEGGFFASSDVEWGQVSGGVGGGGGQPVTPTEVTSGPTYTVLLTDDIIAVNQTVGAPIEIILPAASTFTGSLSIKDVKGDAGTNPIVITPDGSDTIDGLSAGSELLDLEFDYASMTIWPLPDGTGWFIL